MKGRKEKDSEERWARKVFALDLEGKDSEERTARNQERTARKGQRGKDSEKRTVRKGRKDG